MALFDKKEDIYELMEKFEKSAVTEVIIEAENDLKIKLSKVDMSKQSIDSNYITETKGQPPYYPPYMNAPAYAGAGAPVSADDAPVSASVPAVSANDSGTVIKAPIIGTFYMSASPEAAPFVKVGDKVAKGAVVCILEAMKVMNEIECEEEGGCEIVEILASDGDAIQYGQPLFRIK